MRLSAYFLPTLKEAPAEATIASHRLMLRAGLIVQTASGIYSWLPLGLNVLSKITRIIEEEQEAIGANKILMTTIQPVELWRESGRDNSYGEEMLRFKDRRGHELLYSPTNEEQVTDIFRRFVKSYRQLPQMLFQVHWKFRDEMRPRFGIMRGREFLMKDGYSFDLDLESAKKTYKKIFDAYLTTFRRMGLVPIPVRADSGAIGGDMSHEFQILAETGESVLFYDALLLEPSLASAAERAAAYAVSQEKHNPYTCSVPPNRLRQSRGIEVGHVFYFGTKYTRAMNASIMGPEGTPIYPEMGSYGIGVTRLVGAIIEASHDEKGIVWPEAVAPFRVGLVSLHAEEAACAEASTDLYTKLSNAGIEVLYDDREERMGVKLSDMDLIGLPWQVLVGPKKLAAGVVELKNRKTGEVQELSQEGVLNFLGRP
ncbi:MAG: proline--tRNA ligase [Holosporales bacterium]|jgi:prolyl-tRNA synthetase|nr:proline--tRNA ligase [Holosporales bacterium]